MNKQLFCFTYAGGTASFFDIMDNDLTGIDMIKLEYAGHGVRRKEPYYNDYDELADDLFQRMRESYNGGEYALLGYSMGSITLVEVLRRIIASGMKLPSTLFLAAHEPQTKSELLDFSSDETDEWVKERTLQFGGVPDELVNNSVFWRTYLPMYRADYTLIGKYDFDKLELKTDIHAIVFYSEEDTPLSEMKLWQRFFPCEFFQYSGTHFFLQQHHREIGNVIRNKMRI